MKIAFIVDPLDEFKIYKDTTYAIMREAAQRGHELYAMLQEDLAWRGGVVTANASRLHLTARRTRRVVSRRCVRGNAAHAFDAC